MLQSEGNRKERERVACETVELRVIDSTRNTGPGERHTRRGTETPQYEDRKRADNLKILKLKKMAMYINEYY
jgi:hypothetical protein